eukprot:scaffold634_cov217-Alexandrium_tamarense.AAC.2
MKVSSPFSTLHSFDSLDDEQSSHDPPTLSSDQAIALASKMRRGLEPLIKDRSWRFQSYKDCFKHSHAVSWALENVDPDEGRAVEVLNELVDMRLVSHVVDPTKKFRVGENRRLYFKMNNELLDDEFESGNKTDTLVANRLGSSSNNNNNNNNNTQSLEAKLEGLQHVLTETTQELHNVHGKLEMMHQQVMSLASQQLSIFLMVLVLYGYVTIVAMLPSTSDSVRRWWTVPGLAATIVLLMALRCGLKLCIYIWNNDESRMIPMETISTADESVAAGNAVSVVKDTTSYERQSSLTAMLSKSIGSIVGAGRKSSKSLSDGKKTTILMRQPYSLPDVETWPHRPLFVCLNTPVSPNLRVPKYGLGPLPLGQPFRFSSDLFEGVCLIRIKQSNSDDTKGDEEYFSGRKRIFQSIVQGRFKEEGIRVSDVLTGHEFARPLKNLPHPWVLRTASSFIGKVAPGSNVVVHTDQPKVEAILAGSSQNVRGGELVSCADEPGNEPNITCRTIQEDCSVFGGVFKEGNVSASRRKRLFSHPEKSNKYSFDTETTYTFEFFQNLFDANTYSLDLGFAK